MTRHDDAVFDAVVLAGGAGRRMGGVDKPGLTVGKTTLVQRAIDAVGEARRIVVVGPTRSELAPHIIQTHEHPSGSGPVAATAAGLQALPPPYADVVVVLAADLPFVDASAVDVLLDARRGARAIFATDDRHRTQYLFGAWERSTLTSMLASLDTAENQPMRAIVPAASADVAVPAVDDCDTAEDLRRARERAALDATGIGFARNEIRERLSPISVRRVTPTEGEGAVLAEPLIAHSPLPHVDTSAMDGYALRGGEPWTLREDIAYAGTTGLAALEPSEAVRIATGARIPPGADAVVRDEHIVVGSDGRLRRHPDAPVRDDTRRSGEDWAAGTELIPAGTPVSSAVVSVSLSAEVGEIAVRGPVRARTVASGNEIRAHGTLEPGQTRDSIGPIMPLYLRSCGISMTDSVHLTDTSTAFDELFAGEADVDLLIVIGATGGGAADQLRAALDRAGAEIVVGRIPVRPGGSQITAVLPNGIVVLGLPGNPLAAISTLMMTAPAIVDALTARTPARPWLGYLTNPEDMDTDTTRIVPVVRDGTRWRANTSVRTAHLLHLVGHDALAVIPPHVTSDAPVELLPLLR